MRSFLAVVLILSTVACAHRYLEPHTGVVVAAGSCFDSSSHDSIDISIINGTNVPVAFSTYGASGPPYSLNPRAFDVVADATPVNPTHWSVILEEFTPPDHEVRIGAGDRAEFHAYTSRWPTSAYPGKVKLRVRDIHGYLHDSDAVPVCAPGSAPNNSFKPNPLRSFKTPSGFLGGSA
jgi:hypothetical protein